MTKEENKYFYRFRTLKHIFEYKELENLEIYFASNEELNDPMEAYKTVIFQGDNIMWHNLFKNYILCLSRFILANGVRGITDNVIRLEAFNNLIPFKEYTYTKYYHEIFINIHKKFREYFTSVIDEVFTENDVISSDELEIYLITFNHVIVYIIIALFQKLKINKLNKYIELNKSNIINLLNELKALLKEYIQEENYTAIITDCYAKAINFKVNIKDKMEINKNIHDYIFLGKFVQEYVEYLTNFVKLKNYIASFNNDYTNPVMWSHYTENHNGICLVYKNINNEIELYDNKNNRSTLYFHKVRYDNKNYKKIYTINFFYSFLIDNKTIMDNWFKDIEKNKLSNLYSNFQSSSKYINNTLNRIVKPLYKTEHWEYEKEYRLILEERTKLNKEDKLYKYDFKYLNGIIFGIKTPLEAKLKIIQIIDKLCKKYNTSINHFNFYQAYYSDNENKIKYYEFTPNGA